MRFDLRTSRREKLWPAAILAFSAASQFAERDFAAALFSILASILLLLRALGKIPTNQPWYVALGVFLIMLLVSFSEFVSGRTFAGWLYGVGTVLTMVLIAVVRLRHRALAPER